MKETIQFKKDIIFKTTISEISNISLVHDYKVDDNLIEGDFTLEGSYKMTEASMLEESFYYTIPFSIALSDRIEKSSINLLINDFSYDFKKDILSLNIKLDMMYEEVSSEVENNLELEEIIEEVSEERKGGLIDDSFFEIPEESKELEFPMEENIIDIKEDKLKMKDQEKEIEETKESINEITKHFSKEDSYVTYKVYIVRDGDTFESISNKYNVKLDDIKEYNNTENISIGDKIVIPYIKNE